VQLKSLKNRMRWNAVGRQAVKTLAKPGEPQKSPEEMPKHGGIC
jgi:hypothetical protein